MPDEVALLQQGTFLEPGHSLGLTSADLLNLRTIDPKDLKVNGADLATAATLLMFTMAITSLFYLTNSSSSRLRSYTWSLLDTTLSIVIAIMLFEAAKDVMLLLVDPDVYGYFGINLVLAMLCTAALQFMSLAIVRAQGESQGIPLRVLRTRAFAGTVARFCGFSWITFWAFLQVDGEKASRIAISVPIVAGLLGLLLMALIRVVRLTVIFADGVVDEEEKEWELMTCRTEIDALSLCLSFVITQIARYYIGGVMPNPKGAEQKGSTAGFSFDHSADEITRLLACAISSKLLSVLVSRFAGDHPPGDSAQVGGDWLQWVRWASSLVVVQTFSKTTGWLLLFTVSWITFNFTPLENPDSSVQVRTIIALVCSYFSFAVISMLDKVPGDGKWKVETLTSIAVMSGFAWRRCYGLTIDFFTSSYGPYMLPKDPLNGEILMEIGLSLPFVAVLMPAHYLYIVPNAILAAQK